MNGSHPERPTSSRTVVLIASLLTGLATPANAQHKFFYFGWSSAWGEASSIDCLDSFPPQCGKGSSRSIQGLQAPTAGLGLLSPAQGPVQFETGLFLAPKGWSVTTPTLQVLYLEVPFLARLGYWPRSGTGSGGGFLAGVAPDLDVTNPAHSDLAMILGVEFQIPVNGAEFSMGLRYAEGLNTIYYLRNHAMTFLFGLSPAAKHEPG